MSDLQKPDRPDVNDEKQIDYVQIILNTETVWDEWEAYHNQKVKALEDEIAELKKENSNLDALYRGITRAALHYQERIESLESSLDEAELANQKMFKQCNETLEQSKDMILKRAELRASLNEAKKEIAYQKEVIKSLIGENEVWLNTQDKWKALAKEMDCQLKLLARYHCTSDHLVWGVLADFEALEGEKI